MMESMEYLWIIAIIAGCIVSSIRLSKGAKFDEILVVVRSLGFLNRTKFDAYYSIIDGEWSRRHNPDFMPIHMIYLQEYGLVESYDEYVVICREAKPKIYGIFHHILINTIRDVLIYVLPIILLPAILFWQYWYFYLIGAVMYFMYMLITDALGWFVQKDEVVNRTQTHYY